MVDGSLESPCRVLVKRIGLLFLSLTVEALQGKTLTRCYQERVGYLEPRFQGEGVIPGEYFLVSTKLDKFCYPTVQTALCYVYTVIRFRLIHSIYSLLPGDTMLVQSCSRRVSVCLPVTSRCSTEAAKCKITQTTPHDSSGTQVS